jgi:membrane protease YdiL (CAAX protease family)
MSDEITPHAKPIEHTGEPEWFPPPEDDLSVAEAPPPRGIHYVFYGKDGLRAGWAFALYLLLIVIIGFGLNRLLRILIPDQTQPLQVPPSLVILVDYGQFIVEILAALFVAWRERRRFAAYGLGPIAGRVKQFVTGLGWGVVLLGGLVIWLSTRHLLVFHGQLLFGWDVVKWGAVWAFAFLGVGLFEEFLTRGFAQFTLARGVAGVAGALGMQDRSRKVLGFWVAALFFSFIFGFGHKNNVGESPVGLVSAGLIGLVFAFSLWRTGSLWWAIGYHAGWDWAQSFLFGVRDSGQLSAHRLMDTSPMGPVLLSGGLTGPEGSVFVLGAVALTAIVIAATLKPQPGSASMET